MNAISDGVVIGVVLGLVFAAVSYYLYSRVGQLERKVGLMENILLDLKVTTEQTLLSATEPPEPTEQIYNVNHYSTMNTQENQDQEQVRPRTPQGQSVQETQLTQEADTVTQSPPTTNSAETREMFVSEAPRVRTPSSTVQVEREKTPVHVNYEAMTYKELRTLAQQKGVSGLRTMSKAQVIDALRGNPSRQEQQSELTNWTSGTVNFNEDGQGTSLDNLGSAQSDSAAGLEEVAEPELSLVSDE